MRSVVERNPVLCVIGISMKVRVVALKRKLLESPD